MDYRELYNNNLRGKIPKELGKVKNVISMYLYGNKFEGNIPKSFAKLKSFRFLLDSEGTNHSFKPQVFDVFNNDLCGTIRANGPFRSFTMESFEHKKLKRT